MLKKLASILIPIFLVMLLMMAFGLFNKVLADKAIAKATQTAYHQGAFDGIKAMQDEAVENGAGRWVCDEGADQPRFEWVICVDSSKAGGL